MTRQCGWLSLAALLLMVSSVGCSSSQVVRGQNVEGMQTVNAGTEWDPYCDPYGGHGGQDCVVKYRVPSDYVYPPPGDAPSTVVYPYYTHKGPDCFFAK